MPISSPRDLIYESHQGLRNRQVCISPTGLIASIHNSDLDIQSWSNISQFDRFFGKCLHGINHFKYAIIVLRNDSDRECF